MTRIVFFTDTEWSLGRFYTELTKRLWSYNIDCHILYWGKSYNREEIQEQIAITDFWVTNPHAIQILHNDYGIPLEKCIAVIYHTIDAEELKQCNLNTDRLRKLATVSPIIQSQCLNWSRIPEIVSFGINTNAFKCSLPSQLKTLGFGGVYATREHTVEWEKHSQLCLQPLVFKRGYLVKEIADELNLSLKIANSYHTTFNTMPGFYNSVDCIICASRDEGAGGPVLEGGAAGRLIITTKTGTYHNLITKKGADGVSVSEELFKKETIQLLKYYINNPKAFQNRCAEIQEYALKTYDFINCIDQWVNLLKKD